MKYKRVIFSAILILIIFSLFLSLASADVWVSGYTRKDGTYVKGHYRSSPDGDPTNNWSYPGNVNPYTGKVAPGNPETYLKNYYDSNYKSSPGDVWVDSYFRKDGTYVQGHWRSSPDGDPTNNYSFPGNINPNTGKVATGNTETYLKNYYNINSNSFQKIGFSSIDDVHTAVTNNNIGKVINAPPITIGSSIEDVIRAMGSPESIQSSPNTFKYRYSFVYFDNDWNVQSWVDKGNLKVYLYDDNEDDLLSTKLNIFDEIFESEDDLEDAISPSTEDKKTINVMIEDYLDFLINQ